MMKVIAAAAIATALVYFDSGKNSSRYYKSADNGCDAKITTLPLKQKRVDEKNEIRL